MTTPSRNRLELTGLHKSSAMTYPDPPMRCFLYARKSTEDKSRQIQSIPDQIDALTRLGKDRGSEIVAIIEDQKSAKDTGRIGFSSMIERIKRGEAHGILCWNIDRLSRNPKDSGELMWMLQKGIIQAIITPERTYYPEDSSILLSVETGRSTDYIRKLSTDVKRGMSSKIEKGWMPCRAPLGYRNEREALKGQKRILPDSTLFPIVQSLWKKLLADQSSTMQLYRYMQEQCPLYRNGKPLAFSSFHALFQNPFYCGLFRWRGELHIGHHEPMVNQSEFDEAQLYLRHGKGTRDRKLNFPLKGLFHCGTCDACITAERKTKYVKSLGKNKDYDFYRCVHRKNAPVRCREKPLASTAITDQLIEKIEVFALPDEILLFGMQELQAMNVAPEESPKEKLLQEHLSVLSRKISAIEQNIAEEPDADTRALMKRRLNQLRIEHKTAGEDLQTAKEQRGTRYSDIRDRLSLILKAKHTLVHGSPDQKRRIVQGIGSNWRISGQKLQYEPHYVSLALKQIRKTHAKEIAMIEPLESRSRISERLRCELVSTVWSG